MASGVIRVPRRTWELGHQLPDIIRQWCPRSNPSPKWATKAGVRQPPQPDFYVTFEGWAFYFNVSYDQVWLYLSRVMKFWKKVLEIWIEKTPPNVGQIKLKNDSIDPITYFNFLQFFKSWKYVASLFDNIAKFHLLTKTFRIPSSFQSSSRNFHWIFFFSWIFADP